MFLIRAAWMGAHDPHQRNNKWGTAIGGIWELDRFGGWWTRVIFMQMNNKRPPRLVRWLPILKSMDESVLLRSPWKACNLLAWKASSLFRWMDDSSWMLTDLVLRMLEWDPLKWELGCTVSIQCLWMFWTCVCNPMGMMSLLLSFSKLSLLARVVSCRLLLFWHIKNWRWEVTSLQAVLGKQAVTLYVTGKFFICMHRHHGTIFNNTSLTYKSHSTLLTLSEIADIVLRWVGVKWLL